jgi:AcrR family transcriptional regulator
VRKTYDAADSRERLLQAAQELFGEYGFEHTTTRRIAERANVDAALIARYFGGKDGLYLAAVATDATSAGADHLDSPRKLASWLFARTRETGPGPVIQALVRSDTAPEIRAAASARLNQLILDPLEAQLRARGVPQARLRAEIVVFSVVGLVIGRAQAGSGLDTVGHDELVELVTDSLSAIMPTDGLPVGWT